MTVAVVDKISDVELYKSRVGRLDNPKRGPAYIMRVTVVQNVMAIVSVRP